MIENKETKGYVIKRINEPMSREELEKIASSIQSEEDCINYHMSQLENYDKNDKAVIILDREENEKCYKELKKSDAKEYFEYLLDSGRVNSKPKEVTRMGYSESSKKEFDEMVKQEKEETKYINEFTMPSFDEVWDNIYVNTYNGDIYNETPDQLPDELREGVGVIIPGIIDKEEDYFEFVKRLKDRGKDGLGRTIYDKYEDYIEATEIIGTYIQAVYDKYGGKEEFYSARDMGGLFGGYEYIPTVKPRYKKTKRNLRMAAGEISDDRFNVVIPDLGARIWEERYGSGNTDDNEEDYETEYDDLGARIWEERQEMERKELVDEYGEEYVEEYYDVSYDDEEDDDEYDYWFIDNYEDYDIIYDDEDESYEDDDSIIIIDDVPDEFYSTDLYKQISNFKSNEELIKKLLVSKDVDDIRTAKRMIAEIENEELYNSEIYESKFIDILGRDAETMPIDAVINQYAYDKTLYEYGVEAADEMSASNPDIQNAYRNMMKDRAEKIYDLDPEYNVVDIEDYADYATKYMYDETFKQIEDEKKKISKIGNNILRKKDPSMVFGEARRTINANDNEIQAYIKGLSSTVRTALTFLKANADTDDYTGYESAFDVGYKGSTKGSTDIDDKINSFELPTDPQGILKYAENNMDLAQRLYEFTIDDENIADAEYMFSDRCSIEDFVELATKECKPMITDQLIDEIKSRKKRKIELLK
mgnify:CR=1 FL=1